MLRFYSFTTVIFLSAGVAFADDAPEKNFAPLQHYQPPVTTGNASAQKPAPPPKFIPLKPRPPYVPLSHNLRPAMPAASGLPVVSMASVPHPAKAQIKASTLSPISAPADSTMAPAPKNTSSKMTQDQANQLLSIYSPAQ